MRNALAMEITERVNMNDVFEKYGFEPNRAGFICCPFHKENTPSLKVYADGRKFKCFGCGEGGSVIDFVMKLFHIGFREAIIRINYDFGLGLPIGGKLSAKQRHEMSRAARKHREKQEAARREKQKKDDQYWKLWDECIRLDKNMRKYVPKTMDEEPHPLYLEAVHKYRYQEYLIDTLT